MELQINNNHNNHKRVLIVQIPAKNEEKTIGDVIKRIPKKINSHKIKILVINDNSVDNTKEIAEKAGADYILDIGISKGLGNAFKSGIDYALKLGADIIVNIDADNQFNPEDIPNLICPILKGEADMVTVSRFLNPKKTTNMPWIKKWGNRRFTNLISRITGQKFTDVSCGFRAYSREAALKLNLQGNFTYTQEVFIDLVEKGIRIKEIPSEVRYFKERKSLLSGNLRKYGLKSISIIGKATRDTRPLTFFGMPGLILIGLGGIGIIYSVIYWLAHMMTTPVRMLAYVSAFFITIGTILTILALIADMLVRLKTTQEEILYRIKKREYDEELNKRSKSL